MIERGRKRKDNYRKKCVTMVSAKYVTAYNRAIIGLLSVLKVVKTLLLHSQ